MQIFGGVANNAVNTVGGVANNAVNTAGQAVNNVTSAATDFLSSPVLLIGAAVVLIIMLKK